FAGVTRHLSQGRDTLSTLAIGGGGYVLPRYIEKHWPGSRIDVVEIDPGVTRAAHQAFGLEKDTSINTITADARNYIRQLSEKEKTGYEIPHYDFIYEDAINDFSVPYQLLTLEFNENISEILTPDGIYMINLVDIYEVGRFLGAVINTLQETFKQIYVLTHERLPHTRNTYVIICSKSDIDIEEIIIKRLNHLNIWHLQPQDIEVLIHKSSSVILTDDYAPVENLLAPVVRRSATDLLNEKIYTQEMKEHKISPLKHDF
ncbi:MAG: fused MFS/spermidine synthase, partial [Sedimentisphaerales bacterium]|nr:fused MFS/spermidine synthase [Sedimentisphaerales bacterium]